MERPRSTASASHRWAVGFRLGVLYGLRRSEILALRWDDLDTRAATLRIDEPGGHADRSGVEQRQERAISSDHPARRRNAPRVRRRRAAQAAERLAAGEAWGDEDLIITTRAGRLVLPRSFDRLLERLVAGAELPRLTSHGLRHTAATHMVQGATDVGQLLAIVDLLGHSPEMLMNTYAHALPQSQSAVVERIGRRTT
jgi:integrase